MKYTVIELIAELAKYNRNAEVCLVANGHGYHDITFSFGTSEGCTRVNCDEVCLYIDELEGQSESAG